MSTPPNRCRALVALALCTVGAFAFTMVRPARAAAQQPQYLVCELADGQQWTIVIENFGGLRQAVRHCIDDLNGHPVHIQD